MWATGPVRFVGCAAMFVLAAPCAAQVSVDVMPLAGLYAAQSQLFYRVDYTCDRDFEGACGDGPVRQRTTPLIGARVRTWVGSRLAADFSIGWAGSDVLYADSMRGIDFAGPFATSATIWIASAGLAFSVPSRAARASASVVGGVSVVGRGGRAYDAEGVVGQHVSDGGAHAGCALGCESAPGSRSKQNSRTTFTCSRLRNHREGLAHPSFSTICCCRSACRCPSLRMVGGIGRTDQSHRVT